MAFECLSGGALDYFPCRYGRSRLLFRGPRRVIEAPYVAVLGGSETYGKFVAEPWPSLLEARLGFPMLNFGYPNAGIEVFSRESHLVELTSAARLTVIQLFGAQNMSNRYYAVHPRRNDRFLRASKLMNGCFPGIDFTEFNFTRHMLGVLKQRAPDGYAKLVEELRAEWVRRMQAMLTRSTEPKILLWLGDYRAPLTRDPLGPEPLFVTPGMVDEIAVSAEAVVRVEPSVMARSTGTVGMCFGPLEEPAAMTMPGPLVHQEIAEKLAPVVQSFL